MFNTKNKTDMQQPGSSGNGTTLISAGTTLKGDISSNGDLRIDGTIIGNVSSAAKIVIGSSGVVDIKEFYQLFPQGPLKTSTKIAGIPKPASCI